MTDQPKSNFARRVRAAKPRDKRYAIRDDVIPGLMLRVHPGGERTFVLERRVRRRWRFATVGPADLVSVPEARDKARLLIAGLLDMPAKTKGPRTPGRAMTAFAAEFIDRHTHQWKPGTLGTNRHVIDKHILPAFAHMTVDEIAVEHVRDWFASMAERPGIANRSVPVLSAMMRMAELWGYRTHNTNPCKNTRRYRMPPKERFLTANEMARLTDRDVR